MIKNDEYYKLKYLKYKSKYLNLVKSFNQKAGGSEDIRNTDPVAPITTNLIEGNSSFNKLCADKIEEVKMLYNKFKSTLGKCDTNACRDYYKSIDIIDSHIKHVNKVLNSFDTSFQKQNSKNIDEYLNYMGSVLNIIKARQKDCNCITFF